MKKLKMQVNGIHCNGCANKIKNSIGSLNIEHQTDVNVDSGEVKVAFDQSKASINDIKAKILDVGFQIESVEIE